MKCGNTHPAPLIIGVQFHSLDDTKAIDGLQQLPTTFPRRAMPVAEWGGKTLEDARLEAQTLLVVEIVGS